MINGNLKSLYPLWVDLATNQRYQQYVSVKDIETFEKRAANEGVAFVCKALPLIGKALDVYHSTNEWICPIGFASSENIPHFLGRAIKFAIEGDSVAVDCVRQLSYLFYKLEVPHDSDIVQGFLDSFISVDEGLVSLLDRIDGRPEKAFIHSVIRGARSLISRVLANQDPLDITPRHGTGATACQTKSYEKYHTLRFYPKLDDVFSYSEYFFYSPTHLVDNLDVLENAEERDPEARACLVPKDSRGPRIISCEPAELMYIQQGLMKKLYGIIENHTLTSGYVNFTDQTINQRLAYASSINGKHATIDMKDASDRVSLELVEALFPRNWFEAFVSCRSETTVLPDGRRVKLNKFAPMGSACCFPVEALVFWALACAVVRRHEGVYVYGDDIICSSSDAEQIMSALELVDLKVNKEKCFSQGPFRESCGKDYHKGYDVTPIRVRNTLDMSCSHWLAAVELANNFIRKFGSNDVNFVNSIEDVIGPIVRTELPIPGTLTVPATASNDVFFQRRYNKYLQLYEYKIPSLSVKTHQYAKADWQELLKKELERGTSSTPFEDQVGTFLKKVGTHLLPGEYADPHSVQIKWVWTWLG